jgi:hypothetical protein
MRPSLLSALTPLVAAALLAATGHGPAQADDKPEFSLRVPSGEPSAALLLAYLNDNAHRVRTLRCDLDLDVRQGEQAVGLSGQLAYRGPRNLRITARLLGHPALDLGANEREFWFWLARADPPDLIRATWKDLDRSKARWPAPITPDTLLDALGVAEHGLYRGDTMRTTEETVELIQRVVTPDGQPVRKVTVFNRSSKEQQIAGQRLEDGEGNVLYKVTFGEVKLDRASGAVLPHRLTLEWPDQKLTVRIRLDKVRVNERLSEEASRRLFTVPDLPSPRPAD